MDIGRTASRERMSPTISVFGRDEGLRSTSISEEWTPSACSSSSARPVRRPTDFTSGTCMISCSAMRPTRLDSTSEVQLGAARSPSHGLHLGNLHDQLLGNEADAIGFDKRDARIEDCIDRECALVERGQECAWEHEYGRDGKEHAGGRTEHHTARMRKGPVKERGVATFE